MNIEKIQCPRRPVLRYHGGKWRIAKWILSQIPLHRVYVEPYAGGASVLMQKPRSYAEIYNDLDSEVVNVFRVLRDPIQAAELERLIRLTPFARKEYEAAFKPCKEPIERARRTIMKSFAGYGSDSIHRGKPTNLGMNTRTNLWFATTGFRSDSNRSGTTPAMDWAHYPCQITSFCRRLQGVIIENRPALKVISQYDSPDALIYVDPPYVHSSRRDPCHGYRHEMSEDDHRELAAALRSVSGMVIISGYASKLYDRELYSDWRRCELNVPRFGNIERAVEVLWISPNTPEIQGTLFNKDAP